MIFKQHFSGSTGNLYTIQNAQSQRLIVDPGVPWNDLLRAIDYDLKSVVGCLVSHEHGDHIKSVERVIESGIYTCMSQGTLDGITFKNDLNRAQVNVVEAGEIYTGIPSEEFGFMPFNVCHNTLEPLGFIVHCDHENLFFCTDTSNIKKRIPFACHIIAIECSYQADVLQYMVDHQKINEELAKRLLTSHMEKDNAKRYLSEFCDLSSLRELHLLHMSGDNINQEQTRQEFEDEFFVETIICGE